MAEIKWMDQLVQLRRIYNLLGETEGLSQQLAEAIDRNDQVTVQMVMAMREEPIQSMLAAKAVLKQQIEELGGREAERLRALLNGAPAQLEEDQPLANQVATNERLLQRILQLDRILNKKIAREDSVY